MGRYWAKIAQISDFTGKLQLGFIMQIWGVRGSRCAGCGTMFCRVVVPQRVTLPSLKFEQAVICPDGPSPATGEGDGGGGRCACGYLGSVSVRSTDDAFASFVSSTASDRKGFVKGESVPLDRILVPFVRTKGTPRRRAVQIMPLQKAARRRRRSQTGPHRIGEIKPSHSLCRQPLSQPCG